MLTVSLAEAKTRLPELVRRATAGEEIVITRGNRPVARLAPLADAAPRRPGSARGRVVMADDFEAALPDLG